jgi:hypothetical protein
LPLQKEGKRGHHALFERGEPGLFTGKKGTQHVLRNPFPHTWMTDTNAYSEKIGANGVDEAAQTIVPSGPASVFQANLAGWKVQLVVNDNDLGGGKLVQQKERAKGWAR